MNTVSTQNQIQILVIEDEAVLAMYVSDLLENQGYEVVGTADNGREALTLYQQNRVDLVLCDINLKGDWDGIETIQNIIRFKPVPVIYMTAQTDKETVERAKQTYPAAYLTKPVRPDNLQIAVDLAIHNFVLRKVSASPDLGHKTTTTEKDHHSREAILKIEDKVFIKHNYQFVSINLDDILFLEADNTYTTLVTKSQKFALRLTLGNALNRLDFSDLVRVHRSFVVNIKKLKGFNEREMFIESFTIPLSQQYKEDFIGHFAFH
ncbi:response regulator [Spirosoma sp. HMF4905]|uniref:Response regulator n=1 Tax=Spirosoma arboris TaxID=2682092 RepID=A0A7K1S3V6_9BACT|nr:response regulator [Spirosoma arboris]MVM28504.1 response regulator [Spirosoma arboris]